MSIKGTDLKHELVRIYQREFALRNIQMTVLSSDPRVHAEIPCLAINRTNDSEDNQGFNNFYEEKFNTVDADNVSDDILYSGLMTETCEIRMWTENAQMRDDYYFTIKEIALLAKQELILKGLGNMRITGGRDEQDFKTFEPYFIYWATINFVALNPLDVKRNIPAIYGIIKSITVNVILEPPQSKEDKILGLVETISENDNIAPVKT
jgi:hypothetical protein